MPSKQRMEPTGASCRSSRAYCGHTNGTGEPTEAAKVHALEQMAPAPER